MPDEFLDFKRVVYDDCYIRIALPMLDMWHLYENLRIPDMLEAIGLGYHPYDAVASSFKESKESYTIMSDRKLVCSFGVCDSDCEDLGIVWMLGTDRIHNIRNTFLRHSREWIKKLMGNYRGLVNVVGTQNTTSMRWLEWVGAEFLREKPQGYKEFIIFNKDI